MFSKKLFFALFLICPLFFSCQEEELLPIDLSKDTLFTKQMEKFDALKDDSNKELAFMHSLYKSYQNTHTVQEQIILSEFATIYQDIGLNNIATQYAQKSINLADTLQLSPEYYYWPYTELAWVYADTEEDSIALHYFWLANSLVFQNDLEEYKVTALDNIGGYYIENSENDSGVYYLEQALLYAPNTPENLEERCYILAELVLGYLQQGKVAKSEKILEQILLQQSTFAEYTQMTIALSQASLYYHTKRYQESDEILKHEMERVKQMGLYLTDGGIVLGMRVRVAEKLENFKQANQIRKELRALEMKLLDQKRIQAIKSLEIEHQSVQKEAQIQSQQQDITYQKNILTAFITFSITLLIALLLIWRYSRKVQQKNQKIETLIKELHHRVKNNMQVVSSLLGLQSMRLEDGEVKEAVEEGRSRIKAMAMIHQKLYLKEDIAEVDVADYLTQLLEELRTSFGLENLTIDTQIDKVKLDIDTVLPIGLIVNELVCNSFKHAFAEVENPNLQLSLLKKEGKTLQLSVRDNGKGLQAKEEKKINESFGLRLVTILVKQLKGKLEMTPMDMDTVQGLGYQISFQARSV